MRSIDRAVVDFATPRGACKMMITVVIALGPCKDRRDLTPVELGFRLATGAGHLKNGACRANGSIIIPYSRDTESLRHSPCCLLEIWPRCQPARQLKIPPVEPVVWTLGWYILVIWATKDQNVFGIYPPATDHAGLFFGVRFVLSSPHWKYTHNKTTKNSNKFSTSESPPPLLLHASSRDAVASS